MQHFMRLGDDVLIFPLKILFVVALVLTPQTSFSEGGRFDGAGGGGRAVPEQYEGGPGLTKIFEKGVSLLVDGECKKAEKKFKRVLEKVPRNSEANYLRGISLQCQDKHKVAVRYFRISKRNDVKYYRAYTELGMSFLLLDRADLARRELGELEKMRKSCRERCPVDLLKAAAKLEMAIDRIDGTVLSPTDPDRHGQHLDSSRPPVAATLAQAY